MEKEDPLLIEFLSHRNLKKRTKENYTYYLSLYSDSTSMTLTELIEEAEDEEDENIRLRKRKINNYLNKFHEDLKEKNYSTNVIKGSVSTVRSFYQFFNITLPHAQKNSFKLKNPDITTLPTYEEIKRAVSLSNRKYRAIILLMCTSGMGKAEILSLKIQDLVDSLEEYLETSLNEPLDIDEVARKVATIDDNLILNWKVKRIKTGDYYNTFCTPESLQFILDYLSSLKPEYLSFINSLFQGPYGKPLDPNAFNRYFTHLNERGDFGHVERVGRFTSHQLRRWFTTQLYKAGLNQLSIDFLLGHRIDRTTASYFKADPKHLKQEYMKVMEHLAITEKVDVRVVTDERLQEFNEKIEKYRDENEALRGMMDNYLKLQDMVVEQQKRLQELEQPTTPPDYIPLLNSRGEPILHEGKQVLIPKPKEPPVEDPDFDYFYNRETGEAIKVPKKKKNRD